MASNISITLHSYWSVAIFHIALAAQNPDAHKANPDIFTLPEFGRQLRTQSLYPSRNIPGLPWISSQKSLRLKISKTYQSSHRLDCYTKYFVRFHRLPVYRRCRCFLTYLYLPFLNPSNVLIQNVIRFISINKFWSKIKY